MTEVAPKTRTERVSVRVTEAGRQAIDRLADAHGVTPSELTRRALAYGIEHMPAPTPRGIKL